MNNLLFNNKQKSRPFQLIVWLLIPLFLYQNVAWSLSTNVYIPQQYGTIERMADGRQGMSDKTVFLIRDAHCVYEAQKNIEQILEVLIRDQGVDLVCVEGASGLVDTSVFQSMPEEKARERACEQYLKKGLLSAAEALSIRRARELPFTIWGVEDMKLYVEDLRLFRETVSNSAEAQLLIGKAENVAGRLKDRIYNSKLKEFDGKMQQYNSGQLNLADWVLILAGGIKDGGEHGSWTNFNLVLKSLELEQETDFKVVEKERGELIRQLTRDLPKEEIKQVVKKSILFKQEEISPLEFYSFIEGYLAGRGMIQLEQYIKLLKFQSQIDDEGLFRELREIEKITVGKLFRDKQEERLWEMVKKLNWLAGLFQLKLERDELDQRGVELTKVINYFKIQAAAAGLRAPAELKDKELISRVEQQVGPAEEFYRLAEEREQALVGNLLRKMEKEGEEKAVIITGGFHSGGIKERLQNKNIACREISPVITKAQKDTSYLKLMTDENLDIEALISEKISWPLLCSSGARRVRQHQRFLSELAQLLLRGSDVESLQAEIADPAQEELFAELVALARAEPKRIIDFIAGLTDNDLQQKVGENDLAVFADYLLVILSLSCARRGEDFKAVLGSLVHSGSMKSAQLKELLAASLEEGITIKDAEIAQKPPPAIIADLREFLGFAETPAYVFAIGPLVEELIFRGLPIILGVLFSVFNPFLGAAAAVLLNMFLGYFFIKLHKGKIKAPAKLVTVVGVIITSLPFLLPSVPLWIAALTLVFHIAVNIFIAKVVRKIPGKEDYPFATITREEQIPAQELRETLGHLMVEEGWDRDTGLAALAAAEAMWAAGLIRRDNVLKLWKLFRQIKEQGGEKAKPAFAVLKEKMAKKDMDFWSYNIVESLGFAVREPFLFNHDLLVTYCSLFYREDPQAYALKQNLEDEWLSQGRSQDTIRLAQFALDSLWQGGLAREDNLPAVKELMLAISENVGHTEAEIEAYKALYALGQAAAEGTFALTNFNPKAFSRVAVEQKSAAGQFYWSFIQPADRAFYQLRMRIEIQARRFLWPDDLKVSAVAALEVIRDEQIFTIANQQQVEELFFNIIEELHETASLLTQLGGDFRIEHDHPWLLGACKMLREFVNAGVVTETNIAEIGILYASIIQRTGSSADGVFNTLTWIARKVAAGKLDPAGLNLDLLTNIAEKSNSLGQCLNHYGFLSDLMERKGVTTANLSAVIRIFVNLGQLEKQEGRAEDEISLFLRQFMDMNKISAANIVLLGELVNSIATEVADGNRMEPACQRLRKIAERVQDGRLDPLALDLELLAEIAVSAGRGMEKAYRKLEEMAANVKKNVIAKKYLSQELLLAIAKRAGQKTAEAFQELMISADSVQAHGLDSVIVDKELLMGVAKAASSDTHRAFIALRQLGAGVKDEGLNPVILDKEFLLALTNVAHLRSATAYEILLALARNKVVSKDNLLEISGLFMAVIGGDYGIRDLFLKTTVKEQGIVLLGQFVETGLVNKGNVFEVQHFIIEVMKKVGTVTQSSIEAEKLSKALIRFIARIKDRSFQFPFSTVIKGIEEMDLRLQSAEKYIDCLNSFIEMRDDLSAANLEAKLEQRVYLEMMKSRGLWFPLELACGCWPAAELAREDADQHPEKGMFIMKKREDGRVFVRFLGSGSLNARSVAGNIWRENAKLALIEEQPALRKPLDTAYTDWIIEQILGDKFDVAEFQKSVKEIDLQALSVERMREMDPREKSVLLNRLKRDYGNVMEAVPYRGLEDNPIVHYLLRFIQGDKEFFYLTDGDKDSLIDLSLGIERAIREYAEENHPGDPLWLSGFRQLVELHRDFVREYLAELEQQGDQVMTAGVLQKFILCSLSVWGDMFGEEFAEFQKILAQQIYSNYGLFVRLSLGDEETSKLDVNHLIDNLRYASLSRKEEEGFLYGVRSYRNCYWGLRRAAELGHPALCVLSPDSHRAFDESLEELESEPGATVYRIPLSHYTDRSVLFAGPDVEKGKMQPSPGVIPQLIEEAERNSDKQFYLVLDNIEAVQGGLRVDLNPVLWEGRFNVPELGREYTVPPNLHFIFTMDESGKVKDEAFCNRNTKVRVPALAKDDVKSLLMNKYALDDTEAGKLAGLYHELKQKEWKDGTLIFTVQDLVNIVTYARERGSGYIAEETYRYFSPRFRYREDERGFAAALREPYGTVLEEWKRNRIEIKDGVLTADGVIVPVTEELAEFDGDFFTAILELYGYVLRRQDMRVLSQFVRQLVSGPEEGVSMFTILEGVSGEGKTQLMFILGEIFDRENLSYTMHKQSGIEELRGGIFGDGMGGFKKVEETEFLRTLEFGGKIINFSELNTCQRQAIAYFLSPEFRGDRQHLLPEIPGREGLPSRQISRDNVFVADINPVDYGGRQNLPPQLRSRARMYWMGYDYKSTDDEYIRDVQEELSQLIRRLFRVYCGEEYAKHAETLAGIYFAMQQSLYTDTPSRFQVLTMRDIIRAIKLFRAADKTERGFQQAARDVFWGMWIEDEVRDRAKDILEQYGVETAEYQPAQVVKDVLKENMGPLLIHSDSTADGLEVLDSVIAGKGWGRYYLDVNDFCDYEMFIGGGGVDLAGRVGVYPGGLLKVIEQCARAGDQEQLLILDNFHQLNADTAVGFNRIFQDGVINIPEELRDILRQRLLAEPILFEHARWKYEMRYGKDYEPGNEDQLLDLLYGELPANLRIAGISYAANRPVRDDKLPMSGAELSRFISVRAGEGVSWEWVERYLREQLGELKQIEEILAVVKEIYAAQQKYADEGVYRRIRLSGKDLAELAAQLKLNAETLDSDLAEIVYAVLGCGLPGASEIDPQMGFADNGDLRVGSATYQTLHHDKAEAESHEYLAPIKELRQVYSSVVSGLNNGRRLFLLEGPPGVGKTAIAGDIASRLGVRDEEGNLRFKKSSMYREVEVWDYMGKMEQTAPNKFRLTCGRQEDKRFISEFLDYVENGGAFCLDEGNISRNSIQVLSFLMQIVRGEEIELGLYHNGVELGKHKIKVHPDFMLFVTYNPAGTTKGRKHLPAEIEYWGKKIWIGDDWSRESYRELLDFYGADEALNPEEKEALIDLHLYMKYITDPDFQESYQGEVPEEIRDFQFSEFQDIYTYQYSVSPRELIRIVQMVGSGARLNEALLLNYFYQFSNQDDFQRAVAVVANTLGKQFPAVFGDFQEFVSDWFSEVPAVGKLANDIFFLPQAESQAGAFKALAMCMRTGAHTMLISEDGGHPYQLARAYCASRGAQLHTFWGNPFTNSMELVGGRGMRFAGLDGEGRTRGEESATIKGFLAEYLVEKGRQYQGPERVLYLGSLDVLGNEDLEILNDFLSNERREIEIDGIIYVLPEDVHIVVEAPVTRSRHFSSPFFNRFQKVGVPAVKELPEAALYMDKFYPGLTQQEKELIYGAVKLAWYLDTGLADSKHNRERARFAYRYGCGLKDIWKLAELVLLEKMAAGEEIDSAAIVLKAVMRLYGEAFDDVNYDRDRYLDLLLEEVLSYEGIDREMISRIEKELRIVGERNWVEFIAEPGVMYTNGIWLEERDGRYRIHTPGNSYSVGKQEVSGKEIELSQGLRIEERDGLLVLSLGLLSTVGGVNTGIEGDAVNYALPPEEVPGGNFIEYTGVINEIAAQLLWALRRTEFADGRVRDPYLTMLMGPTGGAKSTLVRSLGSVLGVPVFTLNCFMGMEPDSVIGGLEQEQGRKLEFQLKEFFSHLGKIDGEYRWPEGKQSHSRRKLLFLDEANVSPEILYLLRPLFNGQKKFKINYLGLEFEVELDPEVMVVLAGNPEDRFAGREGYPRVLLEKGVKVWVPALHQYLESERVDVADARAVLRGQHQRKMKKEPQKPPAAEEEVLELEASPVKVASLPAGVTYRQRKKVDRKKLKREEKTEGKKIMPVTKEQQKFRYDINNIVAGMAYLHQAEDKLVFFLDNILPDFMLALSDGAVGARGWVHNHSSLAYQVIATALVVDQDLHNFLIKVVNPYGREKISLKEIRSELLAFRQLLLRREVPRFLFSFMTKKKDSGQRHLLVRTVPIQRRISVEKMQELEIPAEVESRLPLHAYAVPGHPFGEDERAAGVFKGHSDEEGYYAVIYGSSSRIAADVGITELYDWVGFHELGHLVSDLRLRFEQKKHPNLELFPLLFPLIFAANPDKYLEKDLLQQLYLRDKDSAYCQAAKGVINGILRVLKEENPGDEELQALLEITDDFDPNSIKEYVKVVLSLSDKDLRRIAKKMYRDAYEKSFQGDFYLDSAKAGKYPRQPGPGVEGDLISEFAEGEVLQSPDVDMGDLSEEEQEKVEQEIEVSGEGVTEKEEVPEIEEDLEGPGTLTDTGMGTGTGKGTVSVVRGGWVEEYVRKYARYAHQFLEPFFIEPEREEVHSRSGRKIDIRRWLYGALRVFKKTVFDDSRPELAMDITVDVSGSITTRPELVSGFTQMSKFFLSMLYQAANQHREGVAYGLSAIGEEFHDSIPLSNRHSEGKLNETVFSDDKAWLEAHDDHQGINTVNLIAGLREKWKAKRDVPQENRLEIVFTDGDETSGDSKEHFQKLRRMALALERECNINIVFVGVGTREVENYHRYLVLPALPKPEQLISVVSRLGRGLVDRGLLPTGDMAPMVGLAARQKQAALIPSLQEKFSFGQATGYKYGLGPILEEILYRYSPAAVFMKGLMPKWYENIFAKSRLRRMLTGIGFSIAFFGLAALAVNSWIGVVLLALLYLPLTWGFITAHPDWRENKLASTVGVINAAIIIIALSLNAWIGLVLPLVVHIVANIMAPEKTAAAEPVVAEEKPEVSLSIGEKIADLKSALSRGEPGAARELEILFSSPQVTGKDRSDIIKALRIQLEEQGSDDCFASLANLLEEMENDFKTTSDSKYKNNIVMAIYVLLGRSGNFRRVSIRSLAEGLIGTMPTDFADSGYNDYKQTIILILLRFACEGSKEAMVALEAIYPLATAVEKTKMISYFETLFQARWRNNSFVFPAPLDEKADRALESLYHSGESGEESRKRIVDELGAFVGTGQKSAAKMLEAFFISPQATKKEKEMIIKVLGNASSVGLNVFEDLFNSPQATQEDRLNIVTMLLAKDDTGDLKNAIELVVSLYGSPQATVADKINILNSLRGFYEKQSGIVLFSGDTLLGIREQMKIDFMNAEEAGSKAAILNFYVDVILPFGSRDAVFPLVIMGAKLKSDFMATTDLEYKKSILNILTQLSWQEDYSEAEEAAQMLAGFVETIKTEFASTADSDYRRAAGAALVALVCYDDPDAEEFLEDTFNSPETSTEDKMRIITVLANIPSRYQAPAVSFLDRFRVKMMSDFTLTADAAYRKAIINVLGVLVCDRNTDAEKNLQALFNSPQITAEDRNKIIAALKDAFLKKGVHTAGETLAALFSSGMADTENKAEIVRALTTGSEHSVYGALELLENLAGDFQNDYEQAASADYKNALSGALVKLSLSGDEKVHRAARLFLWQLFQSQETIYEIKERIRKTFMKMPAGWMARTCKINIKLARHLKQRGQYERLLNDDFRRKMNELSYSLNRERTLHPAERRVGEDEKTSLFDYLFALESLAEVQGVFDAYFRNDPDQYRIELIHLIELLQYLSIDDVKMLIRTVVEDPKEALDEVKANIKRKVEGQENADFVLRRMEWILSNLFVLQNRIRQLEKIAKKLTTMEELIGILRLIDAKGKFYQLAALAGERDLYAIAVLRLKLDSLSQEAREDLLVDAWESLDSWKDEDEKEVLREELSAQFRNQPAASKTRIYLRLICGRYTDNTNNKLLLRRLKQLRETGGIASTGKRDKNPLMMPKLTAFLADNFWAIESNSLLFSFIDSITTLAGKVQKQAAYTAFRTLYRERKLPEAVPEISAQLRELYQQIALPEKQVQLPHVFYEPLLKIGPERQALDLLRALIAALNANEDLQNQLAVLKNRLYEKLIAFSGLEYEQKGELFSALVRLVEDKYGAPAEENAAEFHGRLMLHLEQFMDIINALQKAEAGKFTADLNERIKGLGQTVLDGVLLEGKIRGGALHQLQTILANLEADILLARFKMVIEVENEEELLAKLVRYRRDNPSAQWTDHEGRGIYKLIDIYLSTINDEEVYRNILNALIAEVEGRFKGWKYQSADYQDTLTEIIEIEIEKLPREERKSLRELLAEAEGETLYEKLQQIEGYAELKAYITKVKSWEEMLSYETEDGRRAEFTDDFYTLFNIGNYAGSTACQSCTYGNNLNRGLAGYLVNGTNKAVALLDEEGRVVTRRMVRLRIVTDERGNKQPVIFVEESTQFGVEELEKLYAILDILSQRTGLPVMVGAYRPAHLPGFAQVKEKDFTFEFIAGRSSFDYSDFYGHSAPGQITAGLFRYPETVMQADLEEFTLLVMPESNIRETEIEKRYGLTKAAVEEVEVMPEEQAAKPASPAPQIGKKVEVKEIVYNDQGQVAGFKVKGRKEVIPLAKSTVDFDAEALAVKDQLLEPGDATVIAAIFSAFGRTNASVFTFSELIEDLFGFARPGDSLIALQQSLAKNPLALLHEVMEYLIDAGMLQLRVKDGSKLVVTVNGREMEPIELKEEALAIAGKGIDSPHYLLRALQRQLFGKKDKDLTAVIKAEQLLRDLESIVEIDQEKIGPVRDKIIELTEMIREGREVTEEELRVDVNVILASNLSQEVKFQLIARIARFVNNITPAGSQVSRGLLVAKIEEEILGAIKAESQWKMLVMRERSLREAVAKIAAQKGIPSEEIWGTFDLFKDGMNILTMDPDLDPGQIDEGYFTLIQEIARLTGMSEGKIAKAFGQDYGIEKVTVTQGKSIPGTELSRRADLLGAYNSLWEDTQELLEFVPVAVREKAEPAMVVLHLDQFPLEIFQEEGAANYPPGLMAVLSSIKNGEKVKLGLRVPATEMDRVRRIIEQLSELKGRVELLPEDTGEAQQELERQGFSNFTFVAREGDSFSEDVKAFRMEEGSAFHAVFLFGVMYARADKDNLDEIKDVVRMLVDFGMDRAVVEKILADMDLAQGIVFFTVGLTRISEVLRQFQLRRLLIDVAA